MEVLPLAALCFFPATKAFQPRAEFTAGLSTPSSELST